MKTLRANTANVERPPFDGDDAAMLTWLEQQLVCELEKGLSGPLRPDAEMRLGLAKIRWKMGDPTWLQTLYPEIAECIGVYRNRSTKKFEQVSMAQLAFDDAKRIRAIWREHYPGRVRHQPHDAFWFAAQINDAKVEDVRSIQVPGNKHRQK
jgi:hypothetical protein